MKKDNLYRYMPLALIMAGVANIGGVLVFSLGFQNAALNNAFPEVFSNFGLLAICLWGLAYISVARNFMQVPGLMLVFFVEKVCYVATAVYWWVQNFNVVDQVFSESIMAGLFYIVYGLNDLLFAGVFLFAFILAQSASDNNKLAG